MPMQACCQMERFEHRPAPRSAKSSWYRPTSITEQEKTVHHFFLPLALPFGAVPLDDTLTDLEL
jgi:hypothetical protein